MRGPDARAARLLLIVMLAASGRATAKPEHHFVSGLAARVRHLFATVLPAVPPIMPQAVSAADQQGPSVNPGHLDRPERLERELRAALRKPLSATHLTVEGGHARLGHYSVGSAELISGHVVVLEGDADIHGKIDGNVVALDGDITVYPGGAITGDALAIGGTVKPAGGIIGGATQSIEAQPTPAPQAASIPLLTLRHAAGLIGVFATLLVLGFGLVTFGRPNLEIVSDTVAHSFGRSFLAGMLGQVLVLPTFGMIVIGLALTVAGALLVPFAVAVYVLLVIVASLGGLIAVAHAMGERITRRRMARGLAISPNSYRYVLTGLAALIAVWVAWVLFGWVPVAGGLMLFVATLATWVVGTVGFGAALLSRGGIREQFAGRLLPPELMTDEYLWATPQFGVPAVKRPAPKNEQDL